MHGIKGAHMKPTLAVLLSLLLTGCALKSPHIYHPPVADVAGTHYALAEFLNDKKTYESYVANCLAPPNCNAKIHRSSCRTAWPRRTATRRFCGTG